MPFIVDEPRIAELIRPLDAEEVEDREAASIGRLAGG